MLLLIECMHSIFYVVGDVKFQTLHADVCDIAWPDTAAHADYVVLKDQAVRSLLFTEQSVVPS